MTWREWILSALFVAFVVLKVAEGWLAIESWPLSHVPMFSYRHPLESLPVRVSVQVQRGGSWFALQAWQLGLSKPEMNRRLLRAPDPAPACGELLRAFNASRPPRLRLTAAYVEKRTLARPHTGASDVVERHPCPLGPVATR